MTAAEYLVSEFEKWAASVPWNKRIQAGFARYLGITKFNLNNYMSGKRKPDRDNSIQISLVLGNDKIFELTPAFDNDVPGELGQRWKKAEIEFNKELIRQSINRDSQEAVELAITVYDRFGINTRSTLKPPDVK